MKRQTFANVLTKLGEWSRPGRLLDVGCATGFLMAEAQARGWDVYGAEINRHAVAEARKRFGSKIHQGTVESLNAEPASFRAITLIDCIEHVAGIDKLITQLHDLLEPGGLLVILTPNAGSLSAKVLGRWWPHFKREHLFYPTKKGLTQCLKRKGFELKEITSARKQLTPDYLISQFTTFPTPLVTPLLRAIGPWLPSSFKNLGMWLPTGEMLAYFMRP
jgi:2-polyprenyl-3-methyl-5-hydroxy-6-metoxy-1,4-benzoquinol methylase